MLKRKYCMFKGSSIEHDFCEEEDDSGDFWSAFGSWFAWWLAQRNTGEPREKIFDCNTQKCRMLKTLIILLSLVVMELLFLH